MAATLQYTPCRFALPEGFYIDTDREKLDRELISDLILNSYWGTGLTQERFDLCLDNSVCFGLYDAAGHMAGFSRVVTDFSRFGFISDVYVLEAYRGRGLGKRLMECIMNYPDFQGIQSWMLNTKDAHGLYTQFGFGPPDTRLTMVKRNGPPIIPD